MKKESRGSELVKTNQSFGNWNMALGGTCFFVIKHNGLEQRALERRHLGSRPHNFPIPEGLLFKRIMIRVWAGRGLIQLVRKIS